MLVVHIQLLAVFNRRELSIQGNDSSQTAYMEIDPRTNSTSRWLKRDFPLTEDRTVISDGSCAEFFRRFAGPSCTLYFPFTGGGSRAPSARAIRVYSKNRACTAPR